MSGLKQFHDNGANGVVLNLDAEPLDHVDDLRDPERPGFVMEHLKNRLADRWHGLSALGHPLLLGETRSINATTPNGSGSRAFLVAQVPEHPVEMGDVLVQLPPAAAQTVYQSEEVSECGARTLPRMMTGVLF